jgi:hypothetical protein
MELLFQDWVDVVCGVGLALCLLGAATLGIVGIWDITFNPQGKKQ